MAEVNIHPTAVVHPSAELAEDVVVGPFTLIGADVRVGEGGIVGSHCVLGETSGHSAEGSEVLEVGPGCLIRSHSVVYAGSSFGPNLETGHHVTLREGLSAGENLRVGTLSDLQGDTILGDYVRIHGNVQVGKFSTFEDFVWIFPNSVVTNDPHPPSNGPICGAYIERFAVIAAASLIGPGVRIGHDSLVAARSFVTKDVAPNTVAQGNPAKARSRVSLIRLQDGTNRAAYPCRHFRRGIPIR